jgi:hypothetical protein
MAGAQGRGTGTLSFTVVNSFAYLCLIILCTMILCFYLDVFCNMYNIV